MQGCRRAMSRRWGALFGSAAILIFASAAKNPLPRPDQRVVSDEIDITEMAELPVVLRDGAGNPVAGAEVRPYAMRMREGGGHGYWNEKVYGAPETAISDKKGVAVIRYPIHVRVGPDVMTTRLVTFSVMHSDFVMQTVHLDLGPEEATVTLAAGCEIELSAVGTDRNPITGFGVLMAGPSAPQLWAVGEDGSRRSRSVKDGTWQTMLVKPQEDDRTLFSHVIHLPIRSGQKLRMRSIEMPPGIRLGGKLSDNVPRPVKGYVIATSVPDPAGDSWGNEDPSLAWHDWVEIAPDGSFVFASLPRNGQVQLIGVCEGWLSSTESNEPIARSLICGQMFAADEIDQHAIVLKMEPTGTLKVSLMTADRQPFTEGRICAWPNQHYFKGGNTLLGERYRSDVQIRNQLLPPGERLPSFERLSELPFLQEVSPDGTATLTGLPIGYHQRLVLLHEGYRLKGEGARGEMSVTLDSAAPVEMQATVVPAKPEPKGFGG